MLRPPIRKEQNPGLIHNERGDHALARKLLIGGAHPGDDITRRADGHAGRLGTNAVGDPLGADELV